MCLTLDNQALNIHAGQLGPVFLRSHPKDNLSMKMVEILSLETLKTGCSIEEYT